MLLDKYINSFENFVWFPRHASNTRFCTVCRNWFVLTVKNTSLWPLWPRFQEFSIFFLIHTLWPKRDGDHEFHNWCFPFYQWCYTQWRLTTCTYFKRSWKCIKFYNRLKLRNENRWLKVHLCDSGDLIKTIALPLTE